MTLTELGNQTYENQRAVERALNAVRQTLGLEPYEPQSNNSPVPQYAGSPNVETRTALYHQKIAEREQWLAETIEALAKRLIEVESELTALKGKGGKR